MTSARPVEIDDGFLYAAFDTSPAPVVDFLLRLPGDAPRDVLDAGCGVGRLLAPLTLLGWKVTGLEPNASFAASARRAAPGIEVRDGGLEDVEDAGAFDLVLACNDPLQYLLSAEARAGALRRIHRALRPGGRLVLDIANLPWILAHRRPPREMAARAGDLHIVNRPEHHVDESAAVWTHTNVYEVEGPAGPPERATQVHRLAIVPWPELEAALAASGFRDVATYPGYDAREPAPPDGPRIVVVAAG